MTLMLKGTFMNKDELLDKNKAMNVIWIAMIVATIVYAFIPFYIYKLPLEQIEFSPIVITLMSIGFMNLVIGMFISKNIKTFLKNTKTQDLVTLYTKMQTLYIINWAVIESCAVFGLVLAVLEKNGTFVLSLAIPSMIALILSPPRPSILKDLIR